MFTNEYIYPIYWLLRSIFILFFMPNRQKKYNFDYLFGLLLMTIPFAFVINFLSGYHHFIFYETCLIILFLEVNSLPSPIPINYFAIIFILNTIAPFSKLIFLTIHKINISFLINIPSLFNLITDKNEISHMFFIAIIYPFPFYWFKLHEKHKNNSQ